MSDIEYELFEDKSFLILDDDVLFCMCFGCVMISCGFIVFVVGFVDEVKEVVCVNLLVFVVCDLCLKDGDGLEVVKFLYVLCLDCCVVMFIGYGNIVMVVVVVKVGVVDYLFKLADVDDIIKVFFVYFDDKLELLENLMFVDCVCWEYI